MVYFLYVTNINFNATDYYYYHYLVKNDMKI